MITGPAMLKIPGNQLRSMIDKDPPFPTPSSHSQAYLGSHRCSQPSLVSNQDHVLQHNSCILWPSWSQSDCVLSCHSGSSISHSAYIIQILPGLAWVTQYVLHASLVSVLGFLPQHEIGSWPISGEAACNTSPSWKETKGTLSCTIILSDLVLVKQLVQSDSESCSPASA